MTSVMPDILSRGGQEESIEALSTVATPPDTIKPEEVGPPTNGTESSLFSTVMQLARVAQDHQTHPVPNPNAETGGWAPRETFGLKNGVLWVSARNARFKTQVGPHAVRAIIPRSTDDLPLAWTNLLASNGEKPPRVYRGKHAARFIEQLVRSTLQEEKSEQGS